MDRYIDQLLAYGLERGLLEEDDRIWARNALLEVMGLTDYQEGPPPEDRLPLEEILAALTDDAAARGLCGEDIVSRDLFDTRLMGVLTPRPAQVRARFGELYRQDPRAATDWFYAFSGDTNYIRRSRIARDVRWKLESRYGALDITINLSKPEKDPRVMAAMRKMANTSYPLCALCPENEGYAGRMNHPARQNHRIIPVTVTGEPWYFQYSPYVYFNEHCILLSREHRPMEITGKTFRRLLDFITQFPHYFMGSNADLPIVGGSIQIHDHFQGGRYTFPMDRAAEERRFVVRDFPDVAVAMVHWPLSVLRLRGEDPERVARLADRVLEAWRGYSDESAMIRAFSDGEPHNTITPIARRRGTAYELDLTLRNNLATEEHPMGLYHPHQEIHHIKWETIGLIEVMGLAILPPRLKPELAAVGEALISGACLKDNPLTAVHAPWGERLRRQYPAFTRENVREILRKEAGLEFLRGLEHSGVFKCDGPCRAAFCRFVETL